MKIIVADKISERGIALLRETGWEVIIPTAASLRSEISNAEGLIVRSATKANAALIEKAPKLRVIGRAGVGVDNVDVEAATRRGILVMNTPGGNAVSVAEHTFALMLALARAVPQANASTQAGRWEKSAFSGTELRGKTLGLVGLGRVGMEVARRARGLEMKVLAHDPYVTPAAAREVEVELVPLDDVLRQSDVVSLHTSLSAATEKMIGAEAIGKMKKGARLVNCARGELIDEAALAEALRSGHLGGAALDTFAQEPPKNSPLIGLPNLIATPHIAGSTAEAQEEVGTSIALQVRDYLADGLIRNAVNMPALSPDQYRRIGPYLELGERLGSFIAQAAPSRSFSRIRIGYAGEPAELGSHMIRSAVLIGALNSVLDEKVNLVNASSDGRGARIAGRGENAAPPARLSQHYRSGDRERRARVHARRNGGAGWRTSNCFARWHEPRSAARRHAAFDAECGCARRDRAHRDGAREPGREHRHVCAGQARSGRRRRSAGAGGRGRRNQRGDRAEYSRAAVGDRSAAGASCGRGSGCRGKGVKSPRGLLGTL